MPVALAAVAASLGLVDGAPAFLALWAAAAKVGVDLPAAPTPESAATEVPPAVAAALAAALGSTVGIRDLEFIMPGISGVDDEGMEAFVGELQEQGVAVVRRRTAESEAPAWHVLQACIMTVKTVFDA